MFDYYIEKSAFILISPLIMPVGLSANREEKITSLKR
jgi:hypothetical protein